MRKGEIHAEKKTLSGSLPNHTFLLDDRVEPLLDWRQPDNQQKTTENNPLKSKQH